MTHAKSALFLQLSDLQQAGRGGVRKGRELVLTSGKRKKNNTSAYRQKQMPK